MATTWQPFEICTKRGLTLIRFAIEQLTYDRICGDVQEILDALFRAVGAFATNSHKDDLTAVVAQVDRRRHIESKSSQDGNRTDTAASISGPGRL